MTKDYTKEQRFTSYLGEEVVTTIHKEDGEVTSFEVATIIDGYRSNVNGNRSRLEKDTDLEVNWAGMGNTSTCDARQYIHVIQIAIELADELNGN